MEELTKRQKRKNEKARKKEAKVLKNRARHLLNAETIYYDEYNQSRHIQKSIQKTVEKINLYYSAEELKENPERKDAQVLLWKLNELKYGEVGRRETYRAFLTGYCSGIISSVIISLPNWMGEGGMFHSDVVNTESKFGAITVTVLIVLILSLLPFFIYKVSSDLHSRDTDIYSNFIRPYEIEVIESALNACCGFAVPKVSSLPQSDSTDSKESHEENIELTVTREASPLEKIVSGCSIRNYKIKGKITVGLKKKITSGK